ncbi:hypothetical protein NDN08_006060 [Rhodosorus marinus]|uniref:Uncharacterized protein n=1 Tax=Rhodosorus marinus TaxID=101924 RepID=A0AAV8UJP7_9RHOD|nr:hypothetical protein NDN08_006060 [Rhodosorus marinus]
MKFLVEARVEIPRQQFWEIRDQDDYLNLYVEVGHLEKIEIVKEWQEKDGVNHRIQSFTPKLFDGIPDIARGMMQDVVGTIDEHHTWNDEEEPFVQYFDSKPRAFEDIVHSYGSMRMEEDGDDACIQTVEGEMRINLPLISRMCEEAAISNLEKFYRTTFMEVAGMWIEKYSSCSS